VATGVSTGATGEVGEPPPQWLNAAAHPSRRAIPSAGRRGADISELWGHTRMGLDVRYDPIVIIVTL
jgi:hypothetical protein